MQAQWPWLLLKGSVCPAALLGANETLFQGEGLADICCLQPYSACGPTCRCVCVCVCVCVCCAGHLECALCTSCSTGVCPRSLTQHCAPARTHARPPTPTVALTGA
jgi:hypothetical protein